MGCTSSKLDLPAVALCRDRCNFLEEAIQLRFSFAQAHITYMQSLKLIGDSLHLFMEQDFTEQVKLNLLENPHSHSNSDTHLQFHSDEDDDDDSPLHHHSGHTSPLHHSLIGHHHVHYDYNMIATQDAMESSYPAEFMRINYMKKHTTPSSVVYQQRPSSSETVYYGESSTSTSTSASYNQSNPYSGYSTYSNSNPEYPNYAGGGGYYGAAAVPSYGSFPLQMQEEQASSSKPPPSPPRSSPWDFLNLFEGNDKYYSEHRSSQDFREVREEEGIPDLEYEDRQHEVIKDVHVDQKFVAENGRRRKYSKSIVEDDEQKETDVGAREASHHPTGPSVDSVPIEYEVNVVEKKVVDHESSEGRGSGNVGRGRVLDVSEVAVEIKVQFERASECGNEIGKMLEVGKLPYHRNNVSKMLHMVTPLSVVSLQPSTSKGGESPTDKPTLAYLETEDELSIRSKNLSSTLQKLHLWEKKLYNEVKAEEKMRTFHDKKCKKLKRLDERGAEAHKVDSTQTLIRSLSTKIRISIQVVDKISVTINKIRDNELWPQLKELIQGLATMWKGMLECHRTQSEIVRQARNLGSLGSGKKLSDVHLEATLRLEHELLNWTFRFSSWIGAQKGYVRALNNWLLKCLFYEPEETEDGPVPFSPSRIGAPPIFVVCNQWSQTLDKTSEKEVVQSMRVFAMSVFQVWEHDKLEMRQRMVENKDLERRIRNLDRDDQRIQKEIQALDKKIVVVDGGDGNSLSVPERIVFQSDSSSSSLQASLSSIFEAMEIFMDNSAKAYEELLNRSANDEVS